MPAASSGVLTAAVHCVAAGGRDGLAYATPPPPPMRVGMPTGTATGTSMGGVTITTVPPPCGLPGPGIGPGGHLNLLSGQMLSIGCGNWTTGGSTLIGGCGNC